MFADGREVRQFHLSDNESECGHANQVLTTKADVG